MGVVEEFGYKNLCNFQKVLWIIKEDAIGLLWCRPVKHTALSRR